MIKRRTLIRNLPANGRIVVNMANGQIISMRLLTDSEYIATVREFIEITRAVGYHIESVVDGSYTAE
ncbi:hypothetical protein N5923_21800 [Erwiniaceae bacterium BAC15a-03b]|uniref:Uncharacterized protein n=1 Tax=Winslowiella arboricola TaxID=2978220 RepID=A0A9J6PRP9_9GAMM|nr:hypothetical protein [Winslowiella arboricola]MCU5774718.1 hypothetical protein [Winslowiella arboricola]MCU5780130.1 hypothetical protein [Winslowiella arboricola]